MTGLIIGVLVIVLSCGGASAAAQDAIPLSSPVLMTDRIDAISVPALAALGALQRPDGSFTDPVQGRVGSAGLPRLAWVALRQAARLPGEAARWRLAVARSTLARGENDNSLLPKWPYTLIALDGLDGRLVGPVHLRHKVRDLGRQRAPGVANACYLDTRCFNNYDLVSAVLNLELARTGWYSAVPGARLNDRSLRRHTLQWLRDRLPGTTSVTARLWQPGLSERRMAALSDPSTYPLAYVAFSVALLTRAVVLAGDDAPKEVERLLRRSLWQLVAVTGPNGETSWMGRGQDEVWTLAAAAYAGIVGSVLVNGSDPALAARLRRLADVELTALGGRLGPGGLRQTPLGRAGLAGIDHYASSVGNAAHSLLWLELAREVAPMVQGVRRALPSEVAGARSSDPRSTGLLTLRTKTVWIGVHRRRSHTSDERYDFGLLRALAQRPDGRWSSLLPERPIVRPGSASAPSGPLLQRGGLVSAPFVHSGGVSTASVRLSGHWHGASGTTPGTWSWTPSRRGVTMRSTCPRGAELRLVVWLPSAGRLARSARRLARASYSVTLSQPFTVQVQAGRYASAREPRLRAYRLVTQCHGRALQMRYHGSVPALG